MQVTRARISRDSHPEALHNTLDVAETSATESKLSLRSHRLEMSELINHSTFAISSDIAVYLLQSIPDQSFYPSQLAVPKRRFSLDYLGTREQG